MAHFSKEQVVAKIRAVLAKHHAYNVRLSQCEGFEHKIDVELGYDHIENDQLINELCSILWNDTADVKISPCLETIFKGNKTYL